MIWELRSEPVNYRVGFGSDNREDPLIALLLRPCSPFSTSNGSVLRFNGAQGLDGEYHHCLFPSLTSLPLSHSCSHVNLSLVGGGEAQYRALYCVGTGRRAGECPGSGIHLYQYPFVLDSWLSLLWVSLFECARRIPFFR